MIDTDKYTGHTEGPWITKVNQQVYDKDNNPIPISKIKEVNELSDVFNFEVEKYHTYVAEGIIVHNKGIEDPGGGGEGGFGNTGGSLYNWTWDDPTGP